LTKLMRGGRASASEASRQPDDEISLDAVCDKLVFWARPSVADQILASREEHGDFGTL